MSDVPDPDVILVDLGASSTKSAIASSKTGEVSDILPKANLIGIITDELAQQVASKGQGMAKLTPGLYTEKELKEHFYDAHVRKSYPLAPENAGRVDVVAKAYQNCFECLETKFNVKIGDGKGWSIIVGLPTGASKQYRETLQIMHADILYRSPFRFDRAYESGQVYFDIFDSLPALEEITGKEMPSGTAVNVGGFDSKVCPFAGAVPLYGSVRTSNIGGNAIEKAAADYLEKTHNYTVRNPVNNVRAHLIKGGNAYGEAPKAIEAVDVTDAESLHVDISGINNCVELLFMPYEYANVNVGGLKSLQEIAIEAIESAITGGREELLKDFLSVILFTGGGSMYNGIKERLKDELCKHKAFAGYADSIKIVQPKDPINSCVRGMAKFFSSFVTDPEAGFKKIPWIVK